MMRTASASLGRPPLLETFRLDGAPGRELAPQSSPEIDAARLSGMEEGRRVGFEEGRRATEAAAEREHESAVEEARDMGRRQALEGEAATLRAAVEASSEAWGAAVARIEHAAAEAIVATISALARELATSTLVRNAASMIAGRLAQAAEQGGGRLIAPASNAHELEDALGALRPELRERWRVTPDDAAAAGAVRAEWDDGVAEYDAAGAAEAVIEAAREAFGLTQSTSDPVSTSRVEADEPLSPAEERSAQKAESEE